MKFSLSSHSHTGFYNGKMSHVVLHNFTAGDRVQSQEWCWRDERKQPTCACLVLQNRGVHLSYLHTRAGPVFTPSPDSTAAFHTV